ncbi:MAG: DUF3592 domain-containing protein [Bacteroidetes bacterium]|nr:DUF3592 domain-containing protein [Bacteroidota bacterium]
MNSLNFVIFVILLIVSLCMILKLAYLYYFYKVLIKKWIEVEGLIIESDYEYFCSESDNDTRGWKPHIIYEYKIGDTIYKNNKLTKNLKFLYPEKEMAKNNNQTYFVGDRIVVYFNRNNYKDSIIDDKFDNKNFFILIFSFITLVIAFQILDTNFDI